MSITAKRTPWLLLAPFGLLFALFFIYPLFRSLYLSLTNESASTGASHFTFANFIFLMRDRLFWGAVANTLAYTIALLALQIPLALGLAVALNSRAVRGRRLLRLAFFSPFLVGNVFAAVLFAVLLDTRHGLINRALSLLLFHPIEIDWLGDPKWVMASVLLCSIWLTVGFAMLYCLAALQSVDLELYDAARVDGAGAWSRFWHVTLPSIRPVLTFLVLAGMIQAFQLFELPYVLFGGPGPGSRAITVTMYLYGTGFEAGDFHYASAVGWVMVVIMGLLSLLMVLTMRWLAARDNALGIRYTKAAKSL